MSAVRSSDVEALLQAEASAGVRRSSSSAWKRAAAIVSAVGLAAACAAAGWHARGAYVKTQSLAASTQLQTDYSDFTGYTKGLTDAWAKYQHEGSSSSSDGDVSKFTHELTSQIGSTQSMSAKMLDTMKEEAGSQGLDPQGEDCQSENLAYSPLDNIPGEPASTELLAELCLLRCANTTGCTYWTFYPGVPLGNCHVMNKYVHKLSVMSAGDIPGPKSGRVCSAKEVAQKVGGDVIQHLTANLTEAYQLCQEDGVGYSPYYWAGTASNISSCRSWCKDDEPKCHQWVYTTTTRFCELSTNITWLTTYKGMYNTVSSTRKCDAAAEEEAAKREAAKNRRHHFGKRHPFR